MGRASSPVKRHWAQLWLNPYRAKNVELETMHDEFIAVIELVESIVVRQDLRGMMP